MARNKCEIEDCEQPVRHTPRGAAPRGLRCDAFEGRSSAPAPPAAQTTKTVEEQIPSSPATGRQKPSATREWDFSLPDPGPPRPGAQLIDMDANWRQHAGLRAPLEAATLPETARERFSENWERLASEPMSDRRSPAGIKMERSPLTRWLFTQDRFDFGAAIGPLLLLLLLAASSIYGWRLLADHERKPSPPVESSPGEKR